MQRHLGGTIGVLLVGGLWLGLGACGDDDDVSFQRASCETACNAILAANCANDDRDSCEENCKYYTERTTCRAEANSYHICLSSLRADRFECNADGQAEPQAGACQSELDEFELCRHNTPNTFRCANRRTSIDDFLWCDGIEDCADGSDEDNCPGSAGGAGS